jgi:hypothetical protein
VAVSILLEDLLNPAQVSNLCVVSRSPEQAHILYKMWQLAPDNQVPANAVKVALYLYDAKAEMVGQLGTADIQR